MEENNIDININDNLNFEKFAEVENMINEVENIDLSNIDNTLKNIVMNNQMCKFILMTMKKIIIHH